MAQVTLVGVGLRATNTNGNITPGLPTGLLDGDLLVCWVAVESSIITFSAPPTGWTYLGVALDASSGPAFYIHWKRYASGDVDPVMVKTGSDASKSVLGKVAAYRNADTTSGPTLGTVYSSGSTTGTVVGPITGVAVRGLGVAQILAGWGHTYSTAPTLPSGWTLIVNDTAGTTNAQAVAYHASYKAYSAATSASTSVTGTPTASTTRVGVQVAIHEAAPAFSGSMGLAGSGSLAFGAAASPAASGLMAVAGVGTTAFIPASETASGSVAVSGVGTLGTSAIATASGGLPSSGTGSLALGGGLSVSRLLAVTGTGSTALSGGMGQAASLAVAGSGSLSMARFGFGAFAPAGAGSLALLTAVAGAKGSLTATGGGTLALTGVAKQFGSLSRSGVGVLALALTKATMRGSLAQSGDGLLEIGKPGTAVSVRLQSGTWRLVKPVKWNGASWVNAPTYTF